MKIEFNNGSKIESIDTDMERNSGTIRGRVLTNKEFWKVIYNEQTQTENNVDKTIKELNL